jgi:hypothetical protein
MSKEGLIYFYACDTLWCALSLFEYFLESENLGTVSSKYQWTDSHNVLANWVADERFAPIDNGDLSNDEAQKLYAQSDERCDALIYKWSEQFRLLASETYAIYSEIDQTAYLYYYYCRWLLEILNQYSQVLENIKEATTTFYKRYQENLEKFTTLIDLLEKDQTVQAAQEQLRKTNLTSFNEIDLKLMQLASTWREALDSCIDS